MSQFTYLHDVFVKLKSSVPPRTLILSINVLLDQATLTAVRRIGAIVVEFVTMLPIFLG
jgi:hypothetical protein